MEQALLGSTQTLALFSPDYVKDRAVYSFAERYASWWQDAKADDRKVVPIVVHEVDFGKYPIMAMLSRIEVIGVNPTDAAKRVLKALRAPLDAYPREAARTGSSRPTVFKVVYRPNPNFSGRFEALDALQKSLQSGNAAVTAVAGLGGIGKTTLAAEYCHRFGNRYGGVWWIRAEQDTVMLSDIAELGVRLELEQTGNTESDAHACLDFLAAQPKSWLLIYDNAASPDFIRNWLPSGEVRCIITSRFLEFDDLATVTRLDQWSVETTAEYLQLRTNRQDIEGARELARCLGGLPLAAEQAAVFLRPRASISFQQYAADVAKLIRLPRAPGAKGEYPDTVYAAFVRSLDALKEMVSGEIALDILRLCSFLSPDSIDLALFSSAEAAELLPDAMAMAMADRIVQADALALLASLSLLRQEAGPAGVVLTFHRLLLDVVRDWMTTAEKGTWIRAALRLVNKALPLNMKSTPSSWPIAARLMPHVVPLERFSCELAVADRELDQILSRARNYLSACGDREGALSMGKRCVKLRRANCNDDPLELSEALNELAGRNIQLSRWKDAEECLSEALTIDESLLEKTDPNLAITLSHIGQVKFRQGKIREGEALLARVVKIMKNRFGMNSKEYAHALSDLGAAYVERSTTRDQKARKKVGLRHLTRARAITFRVRGARHPESAIRCTNLAVAAGNDKNWREAEREMELATAIMFSLGLREHPDTIGMFESLSQYRQHNRASSSLEQVLNRAAERIEIEHRKWVAKDPENRHFGPPSPVTGATK